MSHSVQRPGEGQAVVSIELRPTGPFRLDLTAWALRRRARNRIDVWDGAYRRALVIHGQAMAVEVTQLTRRRPTILTLTISGPPRTLSQARIALAQEVVETSLGLDVDLSPFYRLARDGDPHLDDLVSRFRGLKPPRFPSLFEALVNAVACQQFSLEAGLTLLNRLTEAYGLVPAGLHPAMAAFPEPVALAGASPADLRQLGFSNRKAESLIGLGIAVLDGSLDDLGLASLPRAEASNALQGLAGIGRWSAEYALLRGLGRLDVYPGDDVGARNKLRSFLGLSAPPDYAAVNRLTAPWAPFQGMVYFHLLLHGLAERGALA